MNARLPDAYFDGMYADAEDPWELSTRWYDRRKYAMTLAVLPHRRYRHAFEPGCSIGTLTQLLASRCDHVTAVDVAGAALRTADARLRKAGCRHQVTLAQSSLDTPWPPGPFDLLVLSEVAYYLDGDTLATVLARECAGLAPGAAVVAAHWRHPVSDYPLTGDAAHQIIAGTPGLAMLGGYRDRDVVIEVFDTASGQSVATRAAVPGAR
jgi:cyclopropane fatty-acyl-phospholipid synthase-like methyltransferase